MNKVNQIITDRIVESIRESKSLPWQKPWACVGFRNAVSKKQYRGINVLMLSMFGRSKSGWYITPHQAIERKGRIIKGSKTVPIVFYRIYDKDAYGNELDKPKFVLRYTNTLAVEDIEGLNMRLPEIKRCNFNPIEEAEKLVKASGAKIEFGGDRACHCADAEAGHKIVIPAPERFESVEHYYAVLFHELTHWVRFEMGETDWNSFGNSDYSKEELVAELGANFFLTQAGIDASKTYNNSVAYIENWLSALSSDPRLIISAAKQSQDRFDWVMKKAYPETTTELVIEPEEVEEEKEEEKGELVAA